MANLEKNHMLLRSLLLNFEDFQTIVSLYWEKYVNAYLKNHLNDSLFQAYIKSDTAYLIFMIIFSLTNGYIGSIVMMFGPKTLENGEDQGRAASLLVSFLVLGLAVGAALSGYVVTLL